MDKLDYKTLSDKVSKLFYDSIDLYQVLVRDAADRIDDDCGRPRSEMAYQTADCWFEARKHEVVADSGWVLDEFTAAEKEEDRMFYEGLAKSTDIVDEIVHEIVHDEGDDELLICE